MFFFSGQMYTSKYLYKIQIPERKIHHMQYAVKPTA